MTALPCPITLHKLCVRYGADTIIAPLSHTFAAARWHVILGKSGVGKSTLLRAIAGLIPYDGTITRDPPGLMAQHDDLLPWRSARDNVTLGASLRGEKADNSRAAQLLADVGLAEHAHKYPQHLSGGQRQRVALARTLYENRNLLLMDEPFSAIDAVTRYQLQNLAARLLRALLSPLLVSSQAIPVYALAPVLTLWFGFGMLPKILMTVLIIYFPITTAAYDGLRRTPQGYLDLARSMNSLPRNTLLRLRLPAALPAFASGLRVAVAIAPIGAVIGEWVGGSSGLGYLMTYANARTQTDLLFAALAVLVLITLTLDSATDRLLHRLIRWKAAG